MIRPFTRFGLFTAWDPLSALRGAGLTNWVAIRPDLCTASAAARLHAAGFIIYVWESSASLGQEAVEAFGAAGWVGQAEGPDEFGAAVRVGASVYVAKALVGSDLWATGYVPLLECYGAQPPLKIGVHGEGHPVVGCWEGLPLAGYGARLLERRRQGNPGFSVYLAEEMTDADWAAHARIIRGLRP